jgi:predicted transcriptional regulator
MSAAIIPYEQNLLVSTEKTQLLRRRNKYDILAVILTACRNRPRTQSWLIRHLGLSTSSAKFFLSFLVASKLVEVKKSQVQKTYTTTANGKKALRHYVVLTTQYFSL